MSMLVENFRKCRFWVKIVKKGNVGPTLWKMSILGEIRRKYRVLIIRIIIISIILIIDEANGNVWYLPI